MRINTEFTVYEIQLFKLSYREFLKYGLW